MPKRKSKTTRLRSALLLALLALGLFALGEAWVLSRTDRGELLASRYLGLGDPAHVTRLVGKHLREGLALAGVRPDSIREESAPPGPGEGARVGWHVGLAPDASFLQVNATLTQALAAQGIRVLSGRERYDPTGRLEVVLRIGLGGRVTHALVLARAPLDSEAAPGDARLAVVVFGFGDQDSLARTFFALPSPFAVAVSPGAKSSAALFRAAHDRGREVVLDLPLEPLNYPQLNPGPGTILVTMKPTQIASLMGRYFDQAGAVAAVANDQGSLATQDMTVMSAIYRELHRRRVPFLHVEPVAGAVCKALAGELGVSYEVPDEVIDYETKQKTGAALDKRWREVLERVRAGGHVIVLVRATPLTRAWLPRALAPKRLAGASVVPLASVLRRPGG